jgi:hypothetical protein
LKDIAGPPDRGDSRRQLELRKEFRAGNLV